jgi:hypothetical protein
VESLFSGYWFRALAARSRIRKKPRPEGFSEKRQTSGVTPPSEKTVVENTMSITRPTDLGCSSFDAEIEGTRLVPIGDQVQFVFEIRNARIGALSFAGRETVSSKRTKKIPTNFASESPCHIGRARQSSRRGIMCLRGNVGGSTP